MKRYRTMPAVLSGLVALLGLAALLGFVFLRTPAGVAQEQQPILEYPDYPPTPTVGPNPTAAPALSAGAELFRATFDGASLAADAGVTSVDFAPVLADNAARWVLSEGRLVQDYAGLARNPSTNEVAALLGETYGDLALRVSFYDQFNGVAGLVARYQGELGSEASYYRYRILKDAYEATPKQVLEKVVDGVATSLVEVDSPGFSERAWHVLELRVVGGALTVTLDGAVVAEAVDAQPLPAGRAGVYTRAIGGLFFDDFVVSNP